MTREEKLQKAHQMFDNRNLLIELKWQREYFKSGYVSNREELFNLWIFDECIKALDQEPCEDAISRQAVLELVADFDLSMGQVVRGIHALPPVTPAEKVGHWIDGKCNRCGTHAPYWAMSSGYYCSEYCPKCGAKMQEVEND